MNTSMPRQMVVVHSLRQDRGKPLVYPLKNTRNRIVRLSSQDGLNTTTDQGKEIIHGGGVQTGRNEKIILHIIVRTTKGTRVLHFIRTYWFPKTRQAKNIMLIVKKLGNNCYEPL